MTPASAQRARVDGRDVSVAVEVCMLGGATELFVDRLNALLVCIGFRRDALSMEGVEQSEWAPAARTLQHVQQLKAALVARVIHNDRWRDALSRSLG